jgi:hypothetical protein
VREAAGAAQVREQLAAGHELEVHVQEALVLVGRQEVDQERVADLLKNVLKER